MNNPATAVATIPAVVNPVIPHPPQTGAGSTPPVTSPVVHQSPTVTAGATQVHTPTTNNTAAIQTPIANSNHIPLNFTTGNQVRARPRCHTTFAPPTVIGTHQPTPNPVVTPGRYVPANTAGHWGYFHGAMLNGVPAGMHPPLPKDGNPYAPMTPFFTNNAQTPCKHHTRAQTRP